MAWWWLEHDLYVSIWNVIIINHNWRIDWRTHFFQRGRYTTNQFLSDRSAAALIDLAKFDHDLSQRPHRRWCLVRWIIYPFYPSFFRLVNLSRLIVSPFMALFQVGELSNFPQILEAFSKGTWIWCDDGSLGSARKAEAFGRQQSLYRSLGSLLQKVRHSAPQWQAGYAGDSSSHAFERCRF